MRHDVRAAIFVGFLAALPAAASSRQDAPQAGASGGYTSARQCAECHKVIHEYWAESPHAHAASNASYLGALEGALKGASDPQAVRRACVWCHAPTALVSGDYELTRPLTREGVTCDFCHTVRDVDMAQAAQPFVLEPGKVKRGPLEYAESPFHETAYSTLHRTSPLLCAGCHEYRNASGVPVLSTYTDWREGPYSARGVPCQECHMPTVPGTTVPEAMKPSRRVVNLHRIVGGSGAAKIRSGLELRIDSVDRSSVSADVRVSVTNSGVGHAVPGGFSNRTLVLAVGVESASGELMHRRERTYRRAVLDAEGHELAAVADLFFKAASVGEDTRLKPLEVRNERFTVPIPQGARAIVARLEYRDAAAPQAAAMLVTEERRDLSPR